MIVLTTEQKDKFLSFVEENRKRFNDAGVDFVPIESKIGWMLPEDAFNNFPDIKAKFETHRDLKDAERKEVREEDKLRNVFEVEEKESIKIIK